MARRSRSGASDKSQYTAYKSTNRWFKNKARKLESRLKANPNDTAAKEALDKLIAGKTEYSRNRRGQGHICKKIDLLSTPCNPIVPRVTVVDQLFNIGLINEKRRKTFKARMGRVFRR